MPSPFSCVQFNFGEVELWQYNELYVSALRCFRSTVFQTTRVATSEFRFRAWYDIHIGQIGMRPFVSAAWEHEYDYSALPISASLVDIPGAPVTVNGPSLGHDSAVVNAGVAVQWTRTFSTYVSYDGQLGRARYNSNGVSGGLKWVF